MQLAAEVQSLQRQLKAKEEDLEALRRAQKYLGPSEGGKLPSEKRDLMKMMDHLLAEVCCCCPAPSIQVGNGAEGGRGRGVFFLNFSSDIAPLDRISVSRSRCSTRMQS